MDYSLDEEQDAFRTEVRRFAEKVLAPHYQSDDKAAEFRRQLALDMAGLGLTGLRIPEEYGGQAATAVIAGLAAEEVGRADFNATYVIINTALISDVIVRNATDEQKAAWLPGIADGTTVPCICITEPGHGTDAASLELKAVPDGDGWKLQGEKTSITLGMAADRAVVLARTGGPGARGVSAFWVDLGHESVGRAAFDDLGSRAIGRASLHFDGTPVTRADLIGNEGDGFVSVMQGFDYSRAIIGLACLGAAQASLDEATQWARDREAFGQPIGKFQGVAFPLAEHATYITGARHVCLEALWKKDNDLEHSAEAAMAKFWAPKLSVDVIHQCLLTLGHLGYSTESPVGQRLRDVIGLEIGDGTAQVSKLVISRDLLGRAYAP
ncbi:MULTISPECIES: acyl-CoA dehydrogenase family protein [unclassified Nocardioides]|uniref:acyl-CoA dehydrogenase family protein n=1 Tax=unclassified Nocardioides TaxID=2615069 RepID=UPI0006F51D79|nr:MULTISPECIES: acyl-CoA dehydrogenase family protein [unclassified Nocardioides]KQY57610.1 acyl-CoA dehydrogenase [Nocardioides sp. Root140]KQZ76021.1 acyl-CoA dehydrogenase [Nocardioides sp. Root151]KRF15094.1 acyl-CoA dehydrogenase [Nocardioides sp. Soil796]